MESGQGGRKQGRRRCAPGCTRVADGWEVEIALRFPGGETTRERVKAPVSGRSAALRWGQEREATLLARGVRQEEQEQVEVPTLAAFWPRFMEGYARANQEKPSNLETRERIWKKHLEPGLGELRLDQITDEQVQRLKGRLSKRKPKTVNNVLTVLNKALKIAVEWKVVAALPCRIRLLKSAKPLVEFYEPWSTSGSSPPPRAPTRGRTSRCCSPVTPGSASARSSDWSGLTWTSGATCSRCSGPSSGAR